ncbi:ABC transporter permease [Haematobacter massiliensis]|uniref:ABC transporter permease n=2 Tax=Haematobacter massiliensis TaxID=195105 RepID=A0A086Y4U2_9RHOB|nr:MlaE family lipid ABC transporter permease subunit [Haematobacter massiliensis]KFI29292.1 ABC transporter permease [Haematobacter massiliensis]
MAEATVTMEDTGDGARATLSGDFRVEGVEALRDRFASIGGPGPVTVDVSGVEKLDTAGAWALVTLQRRLKAEKVELRFEGLDEPQRALLDTVSAALDKTAPPEEAPHGLHVWVESVGRSVVDGWNGTLEIINLLGVVLARLGGDILHPSRLRITAVVSHMQQAGLNAAPIAALMSFLIGVVLAYMGSMLLRQFGAEIFVVDLIAIAVLRELGVLLTAIIVAGRSGSAFTASIGTMKMREEIDAMRVLGLDPIQMLVLPRVLALFIMLPLLTVIADFAGLLGGGLMAWITLDISPGMFIARLSDAIGVWHYLVGIIKAPFFAVIIALIGCKNGLKVGGDAESLGRLTSASVVLAIFLVILVDALFAIFFATVGV